MSWALNKGQIIRLAGVLVLVAVLAVIGHVSGIGALTTDALRGWLQTHSAAAPYLFIGLFAALNTIGLPAPVPGAVAGLISEPFRALA